MVGARQPPFRTFTVEMTPMLGVPQKARIECGLLLLSRFSRKIDCNSFSAAFTGPFLLKKRLKTSVRDRRWNILVEKPTTNLVS
jgi:hypothetical protein